MMVTAGSTSMPICEPVAFEFTESVAVSDWPLPAVFRAASKVCEP